MNRMRESHVRFVVFCISMLLVGSLSMSGYLSEGVSSLIDGRGPWILETIDVGTMILGLIGIFGVLVFAVNFLRFWIKAAFRKRNPDDLLAGFPYKSMLIGTIPIMLSFLGSHVLVLQSREQVIDFLRGVDDRSIIRVNDHVIDHPQEIVSELRKLAPLQPHHSHPEGRIAVTIESRDSRLELDLGRDSEDSREYWVFYPNYWITDSNEIGRIVSEKFDGFDAKPEIYE